MVKLELLHAKYFQNDFLREEKYYVPPNYPFFLTYIGLPIFFVQLTDNDEVKGQAVIVKYNDTARMERFALRQDSIDKFDDVMLAICEFSRKIRTNEIEVEILKHVNDPIFFPGSNTFTGSFIPMRYYQSFADRKFEEIDEDVCYQFNLSKMEMRTQNEKLTWGVDPESYWRYHGMRDPPFKFIHEIYSSFLSLKDFTFIVNIENSAILVHWYPNYYRLLMNNPRILFKGASANKVAKVTREMRQAKIFKILLDPDKPKEKERIFSDALLVSFEALRRKYNICELQVGNFSVSSEHVVINALTELGGTVAHRYALLKHQL